VPLQELQESGVTLKSYSGHDKPVVGESTVHVQYNGQEADLPVIIIKGDGVFFCILMIIIDFQFYIRLRILLSDVKCSQTRVARCRFVSPT